VGYEVDKDSGISDCWILDYVVPHMLEAGILCQVCLVLGRAVLWRMFDPLGENLAPKEHRSRVMARYGDIGVNNLLSQGRNLVKKVALTVGGYNAEVLIDKAVGGDDDDDGVNDNNKNDNIPLIVMQRLGSLHPKVGVYYDWFLYLHYLFSVLAYFIPFHNSYSYVERAG
jgi:hypothetical protein